MIHREDMHLPTSVGAVLGKLRDAGYEAYIVGGSCATLCAVLRRTITT